MRWRTATTLAALACLAAAAAALGANGGHGLVTPTHVGPLELGVATVADVERFAGRVRGFRHPPGRAYKCWRSKCGAVFIFAERGSHHGRLSAAFFTTRRYATANGTRPGSSAARAARAEADAQRGRLCGQPVLMLAKRSAYGSPVLYIKLGTGREHGRVLSLIVINQDARWHCLPHGHVLFD